MKFIDILQESHVSIAPEGHHHSRLGWVQFDCPFCGPGSHRYHMGFNEANKYLNCWSCGPHSVAETLVHLLNITWHEAKKMMDGIDTTKRVEVKHRGTLKLPTPLVDLMPAHRKYLRGRGFDPDRLIDLWQLKATGPVSSLPWRVVVPIIYHGETVSWTSRKINDKGLRWRSASADQEAINHKTLLYGLDYIRHTAIVVEGPSDVWAIGPGAVGTCGTGFSRAQVARLCRLPRRIVCFDNSAPAQRRARDLCDALEPFAGETMNVVLDADDPGSASKREINALRRLIRS